MDTRKFKDRLGEHIRDIKFQYLKCDGLEKKKEKMR